MTQHNNLKDELKKLQCVWTNGDIEEMYFDGGDSPEILYLEDVESFIDTLLIKRTKACLEIIKNKGSGDRGGIGESAPIDYVNGYKYACEDIAKQITKLIETEE